ncbi:MAG: amidohydrolase family protein [Pseudomonadales bacterium]
MTSPANDDKDTSNQALSFKQRVPRFIDPHHHLWDRGGQRYLVDEFSADLALVGEPEGTIYVECLNNYRQWGSTELECLGETQFVVDLIRDSEMAARNIAVGYVGHGDLALGDRLGQVLDAHTGIAGKRFKGVRYCVAWDEDDSIHTAFKTGSGMLLQSNLGSSVAHLRQRMLSLDLWAYFTQLNEVKHFLTEHPGVNVILNHCGGPIGVGRFAAKREEVFSCWRQGLAEIAAHEEVCIKFGGLGMALAGFGWHKSETYLDVSDYARAWRPYFDVCLELFGPERIMFESNFPLDRKGCDYGSLWSGFLALSEDLSGSERDALFYSTAQRVYSL